MGAAMAAPMGSPAAVKSMVGASRAIGRGIQKTPLKYTPPQMRTIAPVSAWHALQNRGEWGQ